MKLLLPTCLGLAAVANAWTGDNCKRFADIYTDGADLCRKRALHQVAAGRRLRVSFIMG